MSESIMLAGGMGAQDSVHQGVFGSAKVQTWSNTPCYGYAIADIVPVATPTDFIIIQGSATKTIKVQSIVASLESTASGSMAVKLIRRSTANATAATLNAIAGAAHDPLDPAATATVGYVSVANFTTLGTLVGTIGAKNLNSNFQTGGLIQSTVEWSLEQLGIKPIILRGVNDFLCINLNGDAVPTGGKLYFEIHLEEDNSTAGG